MPSTTVPSAVPSTLRPWARRRLPLGAIALATALTAGLLGGALPAEAAGPLTVSTTADGDANDACTDPTVTATVSPVTLRNALCVANNLGGAQTVSVPQTGTYRLAAGSGPLQVGTKAGANITIDGGTAAPAIVGAGTPQVLLLDPQPVGNVSVTLAGLTVSGGVDDVYGGGAVLGGSPDPSAPDSLTITDSVFFGNAANTAGGSTANPGGAVQFIGGSLVVTGSTFSHNDSGVGSGGAIYYQTVGTQNQRLSITGSTFTDNSATATGVTGGSAIAVSDPAGGNPLSISGSTISDNTVAAGTGGLHGALWLDGGALDVSSSVLTGNAGTTGDGSAVSVTSGALTGQYNRITGNGGPAVDRIGGSVALTRSWWGCNGGPGASGCDTVAGAVTASPVLTLALAASPATVLRPASTSQLTASLVDALGATPPSASLAAFEGQPIAWSVSGITGAVVSQRSTPLASGSASTTFLSGGQTGTATVTAGLGGGSATLAVGVYAQPAITTAGPLTAVVGIASTATVTATGYPVPSLTLSGAVPAGLVFRDNGDGTASLSGTPTGPAGDGTVTVLAHSAAGDASRAIPFSVYQAPAFTSPNAVTFAVGAAGSFTVTTSGRPSDPAVTLAGTLPSGVSFHDDGDGTATIAGTPAAGAGGVVSLTLGADNGEGAPASQSFTLTVQEAPRITSGVQATARVGVPFTTTVTTAHAYPVPTVTETGALPAGLTFVDNGDGTATISGTPTGPGATAALTLSASNGVGAAATASLSLLVEQLPAVTTAAQDQSVATGGTVAFTAAASGYPAPTVQWSVSTDGGSTYQDLPGETAPTLTFTAALADDGRRYRATFTNQAGAVSTDAALAVGQTPLITSAAGATFTAGTAGTFAVTTSGIPAAALTASGMPAWLSFTDHGDGTATIAGTPPAGSGGVHTFTVTAANGYLPQATQGFALTVAESPSITSGASAALTAGASGSFAVTTAAGYPAATTLSASGALPSGVRFVDNGDGTGTFVGTPSAGSGGVYPVTVTAANALVPAAAQTLTLTVNETGGFTSAATLPVERGVGVGFRIATAHAYPAVTAIALTGTLPSGLLFRDNGDGTATIGGTTLDAAGAGSVTLTAGGATQTLTVVVTDVPAVSLPLLPPTPDGPLAGVPGSPTAGQTLTLTASGFAAGSPVTFGIYSSPVVLATGLE